MKVNTNAIVMMHHGLKLEVSQTFELMGQARVDNFEFLIAIYEGYKYGASSNYHNLADQLYSELWTPQEMCYKW